MIASRSLIESLFAAGDAGDVDTFYQYLHEDVVVHAPAGLSTVGLENERESWRKAKSTIPDLHHEFVDVVVSADILAARIVVTGTLRGLYGEFSAQAQPFRVEQAVFAHVKDEKISELWEIVDTATLKEQLGGQSV